MMGQAKAEQWDKVKKRTMDGLVSTRIKSLYNDPKPIKILLYNNLCPGDLLIMTGALEALHQQYPGRFLTDINCFHPDIYANNPHITKLNPKDPEVIHFWTTYPLVNKTNGRPIHFLEGYVDWFRTQFDIDLVLDVNKPFIYLNETEKNEKSLVEQLTGIKKYWIVNAGWKNDYTIKRWPTHYFQEVVDHFKGKVAFAQIGLLDKKFHNHPALLDVVDLRGKTNIRQLMKACYHAQGGLGTITCIQHMFASYKKPYVVTHGAREPTNWTQYNTQKTFSNIGTLPCCKEKACWRSRVVPLNDGDQKDKRCCELPMKDKDGCDVATCMWNIKPSQIIEAIESYYDGKVLKY
jgi:ADP-heptose:LPS heptosyltransferase